MVPSNSFTKFESQMEAVEQLINIHRNLRQGRGRRYEQEALHHAGVVLCVASWQAYVEKVLIETVDAIEAHMIEVVPDEEAPAWALHVFKLQKGEISKAIRKFNTPDSVKVRDLFVDALDFNPWPHWEWRQGPRQWDANEFRRRTDIWIKVRHSIAHGFPLPQDVRWLQDANGRARLTLNRLEECKSHIEQIARCTDGALATYLQDYHHVAVDW